MNSNDTLTEALGLWQPPDPVALRFRLYHDAQGRPLRYSMQDEPGDFIEITQDQYHRASSKVRVCNGQLISTTDPTIRKLRPSTTGQSCSAKDICVVTDQAPVTHWRFDIEQD